MKRLSLLISLIMIASVLAACATPTPEVVEKVVTKEVEKVVTQVVNVEKEVTKIVAGTPVVEKVVETQVVEVVVTATPAPPTPVPEPVTLRWANYAEGADIKTMERQIKAFQNEYPWVEIQMEIAPWREYWTQLLAQIAAGTGPDVFAQSGWYIPNFHDQGLMLNLTPFVKEAQETCQCAVLQQRYVRCCRFVLSFRRLDLG